MKQTVSTRLGPVAVRIRKGTTPAAPPWVFLHGASGSWRTFSALLDTRAPGRESDIVLIDLPGWGDSPGTFPFTIEEQGAAVRTVLRALGYRSWSIFGHSMGGVLAMEIAASEPGKTRAVVVLSPTALTAAAALGNPLRNPTMAPLVGMYALMRFLGGTRKAAPKLLGFARRTGLLRLALAPFFAHPSGVRAQVFTDLARDARPASFIAAARALRQYDVGRWRGISCPTVLVRGEKDIFTPAAELRELTTLIPHARTVVLAGAGHFAHVEDPNAIAALLAGQDARPGSPAPAQSEPRQ
ncbi:alpha/beta fold hydrolase [Arthrobacter tecti]